MNINVKYPDLPKDATPKPRQGRLDPAFTCPHPGIDRPNPCADGFDIDFRENAWIYPPEPPRPPYEINVVEDPNVPPGTVFAVSAKVADALGYSSIKTPNDAIPATPIDWKRVAERSRAHQKAADDAAAMRAGRFVRSLGDTDEDSPGVKHDDGKLQWHLLPLEVLEGAVRILMSGKNTYGAWNWSKGLTFTRMLNASIRHLNNTQRGVDVDKGSLELHVDHAITELLFLRHHISNMYRTTSDGKSTYADFDDRTRVGSPLPFNQRLADYIDKRRQEEDDA